MSKLRNYALILPGIIDEFGENNKLLVKMLELMRRKLTAQLQELLDHQELHLLVVLNPHTEEEYPAMGMYFKNGRPKDTPIEVEIIEQAIDAFFAGAHKYKVEEMTEEIDYIDWRKLQELRVFTDVINPE